jgi:hypothetical protein
MGFNRSPYPIRAQQLTPVFAAQGEQKQHRQSLLPCPAAFGAGHGCEAAPRGHPAKFSICLSLSMEAQMTPTIDGNQRHSLFNL